MSRYIINILFLLVTLPAFAQDDATDEPPPPPKYVDSIHQLRFGIDILKPIINTFLSAQRSYEFEIDYYLKKDIYVVAEGGWGSAEFETNKLAYSSSNYFARVGINKGMFARMSTKDWDMGFIGARYAFAPIQRSAATYFIEDPFWGNKTGTIPSANMVAHWFEVTGGVRVELFKGLFTGWNVRGKFRLNQNTFKELPPSFIAGYGMGDKNSIFDFNFYVSYALRWKKAARNSATSNKDTSPAPVAK